MQNVLKQEKDISPSKDFHIPKTCLEEQTRKKTHEETTKHKTHSFYKRNQNVTSFITKNLKQNKEFTDSQAKFIIQEKTFWNKQKIEKVRRVFAEARIKINERTVKEFAILKTKLAERDTDYIVAKLTDQNFKQFFFKEVEKRNFLEDILKEGFPKCLRYVSLAYTF